MLVSDPRGTVQSRKYRDWWCGATLTEDPALLFADLVSDYQTAKELSKQFPGRYNVFHHEDFSKIPTNNTADVINFFGFSVNFLDSRSDTKTAPFKWQKWAAFR